MPLSRLLNLPASLRPITLTLSSSLSEWFLINSMIKFNFKRIPKSPEKIKFYLFILTIKSTSVTTRFKQRNLYILFIFQTQSYYGLCVEYHAYYFLNVLSPFICGRIASQQTPTNFYSHMKTFFSSPPLGYLFVTHIYFLGK